MNIYAENIKRIGAFLLDSCPRLLYFPWKGSKDKALLETQVGSDGELTREAELRLIEQGIGCFAVGSNAQALLDPDSEFGRRMAQLRDDLRPNETSQ